MVIQLMFTTEELLLIKAPSGPRTTAGAGPLFFLLFCGSKKVRKKKIKIKED